MGDRATLEKIYAIMRRLLLIKMDGLNPIPRKGTTRHECYRALYEIQELLETRRYFGKHLPQTEADRIRAMTDEELCAFLCDLTDCPVCPGSEACEDGCSWDKENKVMSGMYAWLKQEAEE